MPELSPTTQAVLDAFRTSHTGPGCLAAALRAVADTKATEVSVEGHYRMIVDVDDIHSIADELEAQ